MRAMHRGKGGRIGAGGPARALVLAGLAAAAVAGGCSTSVRTPLPDVRPVASSELSQEERKKAVEELNRKRATHEQNAQQEIEQSR